MRRCSVLKEEQGDVNVVVVSGDVQRSETVLALDVGICLLLQQQASHLDITIFGCYVQGSESFL